MASEGVTKVELHKQPQNTASGGQESELDKEDFQKAAQDAKEGVSNTIQSAKEFVVGPSNDAEDKTKSAQVGFSADDLSAYDVHFEVLCNDLVLRAHHSHHCLQLACSSSVQPFALF